MILIGSTALKYWFPESRTPDDIDIICTKDDIKKFVSTHADDIKRKYKSNIYYYVIMKDDTKFQFEFDSPGNESSALVRGTDKIELPYVGEVSVAPPATLYVIKKSHAVRPIRSWEKHMDDLCFLRDRIPELSDDDKILLSLRRMESEKRDNRRKIDLNMSNNEFFDGSEMVVGRSYEHDSIHEAVAYYDRPLFESLKDDKSSAMCSKKKFNELSYEDKIRCVREEAFVIALERKILPGREKDPMRAFIWGVHRICTTLTSGWFREFSIDNYDAIVSTHDNYVDKLGKNKDKLVPRETTR